MTTEIASRTEPPMIQHFGQSLTPPERSTHRARIGVLVEALLDGYWQSRPSAPVKEEILRDWMDGLDAFTVDEIRAARAHWLRERPDRKPNIGHIVQLIRDERRRALAKWKASQPEPEPEPRERISPERVRELMAGVKRFGAGDDGHA